MKQHKMKEFSTREYYFWQATHHLSYLIFHIKLYLTFILKMHEQVVETQIRSCKISNQNSVNLSNTCNWTL